MFTCAKGAPRAVVDEVAGVPRIDQDQGRGKLRIANKVIRQTQTRTAATCNHDRRLQVAHGVSCSIRPVHTNPVISDSHRRGATDFASRNAECRIDTLEFALFTCDEVDDHAVSDFGGDISDGVSDLRRNFAGR